MAVENAASEKSGVLKLIAIIVAMLAGIYVILWLAASQLREDGHVFLMDLSSGDFAAVRAQLTPEFAGEWTEENLARTFGEIEPFTQVSFMFVGVKGITSTVNLTGTADTASGCYHVVYLSFTSTVRFENRGIENFDIDTECTK